MNRFVRSCFDFLFPPLCHICHAFIPDATELHICTTCREKLSYVVSPLCPLCGIPFAGVGTDHICGSCQIRAPHFDYARAHLLYEGAGRDLIHAFKYSYKTHLRRPLGLLLLEGLEGFLRDQAADLLIPVPLHRTRLRSRGFNQAQLLCAMVSERLSIPVMPDGLARTRPTQPQVELSALERRNNVKGAFAVRHPVQVAGRRILLLDDVMTTGSTVDECAGELKKCGATLVTVVTVARTAR
jgi:ComF family protein